MYTDMGGGGGGGINTWMEVGFGKWSRGSGSWFWIIRKAAGPVAAYRDNRRAGCRAAFEQTVMKFIYTTAQRFGGT